MVTCIGAHEIGAAEVVHITFGEPLSTSLEPHRLTAGHTGVLGHLLPAARVRPWALWCAAGASPVEGRRDTPQRPPTVP